MIARHRLPPGPRGHLLFGSLPAMQLDPLAYMAECERRYGALVHLRLPWPIDGLVQVNTPALAEQVLIGNAEDFGKSRVQRRMVGTVLGQGLFLAEGEPWKWQRRIVQPAFQRARVAGYAESFVRCADAMAARWAGAGERDVLADAVHFTLQVAARTLFGAQLEREVERARAAMEAVDEALQQHLRSLLPLPLSIPTPSGLRLRKATRELERIIRAFVRERSAGAPRDDLLSMLLGVRDARGRPLSSRQLRDEAITAFIAGTETTALGLAWSLHLLAQHPEVAERIRAEVAAQAPAGATLQLPSGLPYTERVVRESLRLYPPFWHVAREARRDVALAGYRVPRGRLLLVMTYLLQRNPRYFPEPERFLPERWTDAFTHSLPHGAYLPFGVGQRKCVGELFAICELVAALATIVPRYDLAPSGRLPELRPSASLRPAAGIRVRIQRRPNPMPARCPAAS